MKKYIITNLCVLFALCGFAQSTAYTLTVKLSGIRAPATAYLVTQYGWSNSRVIDSATLQNHRFVFKGDAPEPIKAHIVVNHSGKGGANWDKNNDALLVYMESGNITVSGTDSVMHAAISGSKVNTEYQRYHAAVLAPGEKTLTKVNSIFASADANKKKDKAFVASLMNKMKAATQMVDSLKYAYIRQHSDSYLSLVALTELAGNDIDVEKIEPLFNTLSPMVRNTNTGKQFATRLRNIGRTDIGAIAPDFTQNDVNNNPVKLSDFKGRYVLLDFWASWCGPCRAENPNVLAAYNKYKDKNFTVLGVSLDQPGKKEAWLAAIKHDGLTWTQVSDLNFWNNAVAKEYNIRSIPQNFLIDPNGKIVAKNLRSEALNEKLAQLLK